MMLVLVVGFIAGFLITWMWVDERCVAAYRRGYEDALLDSEYARKLRRDGTIN